MGTGRRESEELNKADNERSVAVGNREHRRKWKRMRHDERASRSLFAAKMGRMLSHMSFKNAALAAVDITAQYVPRKKMLETHKMKR